MSQNYLYFKNNLKYHSLLMGDKGLTSKPLFRLTPPTFWRPTPRSLSTISFTPKSFTIAFGIHIHPCLLLAVASSLEDKPTRARTLPIWFRGTPRTSHSAWHAVDMCPTHELKEYPSFGRPLLHEASVGSLSNSWGTLLNQFFPLSTLHGFLLPLRRQGRLYTNLTHAKTKQNRKPEVPSCCHCICPFPVYSCHPFCHLVLKPICYSNCFCKAHQQLLNYKSITNQLLHGWHLVLSWPAPSFGR